MSNPPVKQPPFAKLVGITITHVSPERITAELPVRDELTNGRGILHGGAIMALADNLGGHATVVQGGAVRQPADEGDTAHAECTPLHRGRTTMVWQTRITRNDGRLAAVVTQTQLVIEPKG